MKKNRKEKNYSNFCQVQSKYLLLIKIVKKGNFNNKYKKRVSALKYNGKLEITKVVISKIMHKV